MSKTLRGLAGTVNFTADDVAAARDWYAEVLGLEPSAQAPDAEDPVYVQFRIGDSVLALVKADLAPGGRRTGEPAGALVYWQVDDVASVLDELLTAGAKEHAPRKDFPTGLVNASVIDPFGNILGLSHHP
jgi:predicted enzyme related to lactoylglutathione lyase